MCNEVRWSIPDYTGQLWGPYYYMLQLYNSEPLTTSTAKQTHRPVGASWHECTVKLCRYAQDPHVGLLQQVIRCHVSIYIPTFTESMSTYSINNCRLNSSKAEISFWSAPMSVNRKGHHLKKMQLMLVHTIKREYSNRTRWKYRHCAWSIQEQFYKCL